MRAVLTRVNSASVAIDGEVVGKIGKGFLILLGVGPDDTEKECRYLAEKALGLRIFTDENDKMNLGLDAVGGEVLVVSQFTLYGNCRKGRRPSFTDAANPELGERLYEQFLADCASLGYPPQHGRCGHEGGIRQRRPRDPDPGHGAADGHPQKKIGDRMLNIHTLTLGAYGTNCYIVHDSASKTCCVIDPGYTPEKVLAEVNALGLTVEAILLTHGHFDHVGGVKEIAAETGCDVYLCADELTLPPQMTAGPLYYTKTYDEGDTLHLAGLTISVIRTPGHTPGSVCLLIDDAMFSGDTLFAGSCGRTDLPGGSDAAMRASLRRLAGLSTDYRVYPGHGMDTTLAEEKRYNPYLR